MSSRQILLTPIIKKEICKNLTFEDAVNFRDVLNLPSLKCKIPIKDKDQRVLSLNRIDSDTIEVYKQVQSLGSNKVLLEASRKGDLKMVKSLLENHANVNAAGNILGTTALMYASSNNNQIVKILLKYRADVNISDFDRNTPLIWATGFEKLETVKDLLAAGANVNAASMNGTTALELAIRKNNSEIVELLKSYGAH